MKTLSLFFTRGISLHKWEEIGSLEREIALYKKLSVYFDKIFFFTYGDKGDLKYQDYLPSNIIIICRPRFIPSLLYSILIPFIRRKELKDSSILKTNQMDGGWAAVIAKKMFGVKLVVRCGYEWLRTLERAQKPLWKRLFARFVEQLAYRNADVIILTSESDKKFVTDNFGIDSYCIKVVPNYVDVELFYSMTIKKESGRIIFVGRLEKEKNIFNLIAACRDLPVKLIVIGSGSLRGELEMFARERGINVEFKGSIPQRQLPEELNKSEIFVLPSLYEGNPKALLEAMACGLSCVVSDFDGVRAIIKDQETGYLCGTDTASINNALVKLFISKELREHISKKAHHLIINKFSLEKIIADEVLIYESL